MISPDLVDVPDMPILNDEESSQSGSESNLDSKLTNTSKSSKHNLGVYSFVVFLYNIWRKLIKEGDVYNFWVWESNNTLFQKQ